MDTRTVALIAANILYLEDPAAIDAGASLFRDYGMSSIDFIDFAFELKSRCGKNFAPDDLWPVNAMMTDPDFFADGAWTERGAARLRDIFAVALPDNPKITDLYKLFSVDFVVHRLAQL